MTVEEYECEVICKCGGQFTVRIEANLYGCVRCGAELTLPPLWLELGDDGHELRTIDYEDCWYDDNWESS